jgi:metal-responsive CopG/Arc/MetJ family transcriptional regulator
MSKTRINLSLAPAMVRDVDKLAEKYGWDRTNAIRYCVRQTCDAELRLPAKTETNPEKD